MQLRRIAPVAGAAVMVVVSPMRTRSGWMPSILSSNALTRRPILQIKPGTTPSRKTVSRLPAGGGGIRAMLASVNWPRSVARFACRAG